MEYKSKKYIQSLIQEGEHEHQDFKYKISDSKKIARSISAFANNSGGWLLIGVKDNGNIVGVSSDEEIYMVEQAAQLYCRPPQNVKCTVYRVEGKLVVKVDVDEAKEKPVKAPGENGRWRAYYRKADENIEASALHTKVMKQKCDADEARALVYSENERALLEYLLTHGGITIDGYMKLTHISQKTAEMSVVNLCKMGVLSITYHSGTCVLILSQP